MAEHILIIRFSALGDVAMLVPVVRSLAHQYPDVRITVLSRGFARPFFVGLSKNIAFIEADLRNDYRGLQGLNRLYRELKEKDFTAVADMHGVLRSNYLRMRFNLSGYKVAHIDKHRAGKRRLVAQSGKVELGGNLTLADGAVLGFNFTERKTVPVLDVTGKAVTFGSQSNVVVKVSAADGTRGKGGESVLTAGGRFANANITLVDKPDWAMGVSVNDDGDIVLKAKRTDLVIIIH